MSFIDCSMYMSSGVRSNEQCPGIKVQVRAKVGSQLCTSAGMLDH